MRPDAGHGNRGEQRPHQVAGVVGGGEQPGLGGIESGCLPHGRQQRCVGEAANAHRRGESQDAAEQREEVRRTRSRLRNWPPSPARLPLASNRYLSGRPVS